MLRFESPWVLLLLLFPVLYWAYRWFRRGKGRSALLFSSVKTVRKAGTSLRQRLCWLPEALRWLGICLLIVALARPQSGSERIHESTQGVAIEMVLDRSGSMQLEMDFEGRMQNRLETAKEVFRRFVFGHGSTLKGRPNDLIGLVSFARYADTVCPLTLSHEVLKPFLDTVTLADSKAEDGTAIGDAVALSAARLNTVEDVLRKQWEKVAAGYRIKSKVMIVLTDGENNCGRRTVLAAGKLAKQWDIRLYVILVGGDEVYQTVRTPFGLMRQKVAVPPTDTRDLESIAKESGGFFRKAGDARSLQQVYEEIDQLERTDVEAIRFVDYRELFQIIALTGFLLILLEQILNATCFRRLP